MQRENGIRQQWVVVFSPSCAFCNRQILLQEEDYAILYVRIKFLETKFLVAGNDKTGY